MLREGLQAAAEQGIAGRDVTPFLLERFHTQHRRREPARERPARAAQRRARRGDRRRVIVVLGEVMTDVVAVHDGPLARRQRHAGADHAASRRVGREHRGLARARGRRGRADRPHRRRQRGRARAERARRRRPARRARPRAADRHVHRARRARRRADDAARPGRERRAVDRRPPDDLFAAGNVLHVSGYSLLRRRLARRRAGGDGPGARGRDAGQRRSRLGGAAARRPGVPATARGRSTCCCPTRTSSPRSATACPASRRSSSSSARDGARWSDGAQTVSVRGGRGRRRGRHDRGRRRVRGRLPERLAGRSARRRWRPARGSPHRPWPKRAADPPSIDGDAPASSSSAWATSAALRRRKGSCAASCARPGSSTSSRSTAPGTGSWHAGDPPDRRATEAAQRAWGDARGRRPPGPPARLRALRPAARHGPREPARAADVLAPTATRPARRGCCASSTRPRPARPTSTSPTRTTAARTASRRCSTRSRRPAVGCSTRCGEPRGGGARRHRPRGAGGWSASAAATSTRRTGSSSPTSGSRSSRPAPTSRPASTPPRRRACAGSAEPGALRVPEVLGVADDVLVLDWVDEGGRGDAAAFGAGLAAVHAAGADAFGASSPDGAARGGDAGDAPPVRRLATSALRVALAAQRPRRRLADVLRRAAAAAAARRTPGSRASATVRSRASARGWPSSPDRPSRPRGCTGTCGAGTCCGGATGRPG